VPVPLPPPGRLDSAAKAALVGVLGGPGYLILSAFLHWAISPLVAFVAVAAFVAGFVTLVVKLGDRPRRDDDDDGAVL
jgi:predicted DNA repair protein MutK